jgi:hypothetical protein
MMTEKISQNFVTVIPMYLDSSSSSSIMASFRISRTSATATSTSVGWPVPASAFVTIEGLVLPRTHCGAPGPSPGPDEDNDPTLARLNCKVSMSTLSSSASEKGEEDRERRYRGKSGKESRREGALRNGFRKRLPPGAIRGVVSFSAMAALLRLLAS